jgi:CheY-like chemotaxis protein
MLQADPVTTHIPVVALSANAMPKDIENGLQAGFYRYVTKPIRVDEFLNSLDEALLFSQQRANNSVDLTLESETAK